MHRGLKWTLLSALTLLFATLALGIALIVFLARSSDVVARVLSPAGDVQAVLVETNGGATTSFGYEVSIVSSASERPGQPVARLYGAVRNDQAYGVNLRWVSASQLNVEFHQARDANLERSALTVAGRAVSIALHSGVIDSTAPPGGMLYNLQRSK